MMKLTIELIPTSAWGQNLRKVLSKEDWIALSKKVRKEAGNKCDICSNTVNLHCHESWNWDLEKKEQYLEKLQCLCSKCHAVKHLGYTEVLVSQNKLNYQNVIEHFMEINNCEEWAFWKHRQEAFAVWNERSKYQWVLKL